MTHSTENEQALLAEYQACQQDINSSTTSYWTLSGIFIGISTALLAPLFYGLISEPYLFSLCPVKAIAIILATIVIGILIVLRLWMNRVDYIADRHRDRMREIELDLNVKLGKSWRIHILDKWNNLRYGTNTKLTDEQWRNLKCKVAKYLLEQYDTRLDERYDMRLDERREEIIKYCSMFPKQKCYERPSRWFHYPLIIYLVIFMWVVFIIATWFLPQYLIN